MRDSRLQQATELAEGAATLVSAILNEGSHTHRNSYQLASLVENLTAAVTGLQTLQLCRAPSMGGAQCELPDLHDGKHSKTYEDGSTSEWSTESQLKLAKEWM